MRANPDVMDSIDNTPLMTLIQLWKGKKNEHNTRANLPLFTASSDQMLPLAKLLIAQSDVRIGPTHEHKKTALSCLTTRKEWQMGAHSGPGADILAFGSTQSYLKEVFKLIVQ